MKRPRCKTRPRPDPGAGFTLLEVMVVTAIFSLIVGIAIHVPELFLTSKLIETTREEMEEIGEGVLSYYNDLEAFPATLEDLVDPNNPPAGWLGPYLLADFGDATGTNDTYLEDVWLNTYQYSTVSSTVRRLTSYGPNRQDDSGGGDDIVLDIDVGPVLRDITRRELKVINNVITTYNADFLYTNTLSTNYSNLLDQLQSAGYLPADTATKARYLTDAWGQQYTTGGLSPVLEVSSLGAP